MLLRGAAAARSNPTLTLPLAPHLGSISALSRLYLAYISAISRRCCSSSSRRSARTSRRSPLHLPYISPYLPHISRSSPLDSSLHLQAIVEEESRKIDHPNPTTLTLTLTLNPDPNPNPNPHQGDHRGGVAADRPSQGEARRRGAHEIELHLACISPDLPYVSPVSPVYLHRKGKLDAEVRG